MNLNDEHSQEVLRKVQTLLDFINISSDIRENPSKRNLTGVNVLQAKELLLTLPKFLWDSIEKLPSIGRVEGDEAFIMLCTMLIAEKIAQNIGLENIDMQTTTAELVKELEVY